MGMGNQHGVDPSQSILWEPLDSGCLEVFANVDDNGPALLKSALGCNSEIKTNFISPSFPSMRITVEVFLRMFFFPSGLRVDKHVLQGAALSGAVRHDTFGKLPEVPVPKKMNSTPGAGGGRGGEWSASGMQWSQWMKRICGLKARYKLSRN